MHVYNKDRGEALQLMWEHVILNFFKLQDLYSISSQVL